jgi:hypothetical protein
MLVSKIKILLCVAVEISCYRHDLVLDFLLCKKSSCTKFESVSESLFQSCVAGVSRVVNEFAETQ